MWLQGCCCHVTLLDPKLGDSVSYTSTTRLTAKNQRDVKKKTLSPFRILQLASRGASPRVLALAPAMAPICASAERVVSVIGVRL